MSDCWAGMIVNQSIESAIHRNLRTRVIEKLFYTKNE